MRIAIHTTLVSLVAVSASNAGSLLAENSASGQAAAPAARSQSRKTGPSETRAGGRSPGDRFPSLDNREAWQRLPRPAPPLPVWARILVRSIPRATAGMLHLDWIHRTKNPLGPVLSAQLRWVAADANRCAYGKRYAEADLLRNGIKPAEIKRLAAGGERLPAPKRRLLEFARKLSLAAHTITDPEFAAVLKQLGPEKTVAVVHTLAHANFQNRVFLALGIQVEPNGPYPPREILFDPASKAEPPAPARRPWKSVLAAKAKQPAAARAARWSRHDFSEVQKLLAHQKQRSTRIPVPDWKTVSRKLPAEMRRRGPSKIVWSNISYGYQPRLTQAWFDCMRAFQQERDLDRVFANSLFWVITRSNQCFY